MKNEKRKTFGDFGIRHKLFASYMLVIIVPLVALLFLHLRLTADEMENQTLHSARKMLDETKSYLQYRAETVREVLNVIAFDDTIQTLVAEDYERYRDVNLWGIDAGKLARALGQSRYNSDIESVQLYMKRGLASVTESRDYLNMAGLSNQLWFESFIASKAVTTWLPSSVIEKNSADGEVSVIRVIPNRHDIQTSDGLIRARISQNTFRSVLDHAVATPSALAILFNVRGDLLGFSGSQLQDPERVLKTLWQTAGDKENRDFWIEHMKLEGQDVLFGLETIPGTDMRLAIIVPYADILQSSNKMQNRLVLIFLLLIPLTFALSYVIAGSATKRLRKLSMHARSVKNGNFKISPLPTNQDEIGELTSNFNAMVENVSRLLDETYTLGRAIKNKELKALQAQINPHFLYNTLDLINIMGIESGNKEISEVVDRLALFYRLSLSNGKEIVTLESELKHIESYVSIQNMRFGGSIALTVEVPSELLELEVPKITLQPLVENAILHGILEKREERGEIRLTAALIEKDLILEIGDDGVGMEQDVLETLLSRAVRKGTGGFGIRNIQERIQLNYGASYGLSFSSQVGIGTLVQVRLPASTSEQ